MTYSPIRALAGLSTVLAAAGLLAQTPTWTHQAPLPTASDLSSIQMISPTEYWGASDGGTNGAGGVGYLIHTTDGGQSWQRHYLGGGAALWEVFFLNAQLGWAAGNGLFRTVDGGQSWENNSIAPMGSIADLFFLDQQHGWASGTGGMTYRTVDGGVTWATSAIGSIWGLGGIFFQTTQVGWTVNTAGQIYQTTDGGQSWSLNFDLGHPYLSNIMFFDAVEGWAIGGNNFLHTIDGGQSWQAANVPAGTWVGRAFFTDRLHGWAAGASDMVLTTDGGITWTSIADGTDEYVLGVHFLDSQTGMLCGEAGFLKTTQDGGQTWSQLQSGGKGTTYDLEAVDAMHAWAGNDGGEVLLTTDGGQFWERVPVAGFDTFGEIHDVDFVDTQTGWAIGDQPGFAVATSARIVRSLDGGRKWEVKKTQDNVFTSAIEGIDANTAFAFGWIPFCCDFLWRTVDGGATWVDVSPGGIVRAIEFVDANNGWIAGGAIKKTTNAGGTWVTQHIPQYALRDISFAGPLHGWAVGSFGTLLYTADGGATWTQQSAGTGTPIDFLGVSAIDKETAWIVGSRGFAARTTDGGQTWVQEIVAAGINHFFTSTVFLDAEHGWAATQDIPPEGGIWFRQGSQLSPWQNLGYSRQSPLGIPALDGAGSLDPGSNAAVSLSNAVPNSPALLVVGGTQANQPILLGSILVPSQDLLLPLPTDGLGRFSIPFVWPNLPTGTSLYFHAWIQDGYSVGGWSGSNAVEAIGR